MGDDNSGLSVFEKTFSSYLEQIESIDLHGKKERLGISLDNDNIIVPLLNEKYYISKNNITNSSGKIPSFDISVILLKYILTDRTGFPAGDEWCSFRDLKDSGPLTVFFRDNVERAFSDYYAGRISSLKSACMNAGGKHLKKFSHDVSTRFDFLPRIPLLLLFNDKDEEFPASCSLLFERRSENYLDAECLAMVGREIFNTLKNIS